MLRRGGVAKDQPCECAERQQSCNRGAGITQNTGKPDRRVVEHRPGIERVPCRKAEQEARGGAEQRGERAEGPLAQPVKMRRKAGAGERHAEAEGEGGKCEHRPDRADMGIRRQAIRLRHRHPGPEHGLVQNDARGERHENGDDAGCIPPFHEVPQVAQEAETAPLQDDAEGAAGDQREGKHPSGSILRQPDTPGGKEGEHRDGKRAGGDGRHGDPAAGHENAGGPGRMSTRVGIPRGVRRRAFGNRYYLPVQIVPAILFTGTPTALPYSVQEPS